MTFVDDPDISDPPPYPAGWTADQRVASYWHALRFTGFPGVTEGWHAVWRSLENERDRRGRRNDAMKKRQVS